MIDASESSVAARWVEHNKGTWVVAGDKMQVVVPDCTAGRFLSVDFSVADGRTCDFDIMFEAADEGEGAFRLYGPTRRANSVSTVVPLTATGTAYITWDNINAWLYQKLVSYTVCVSDEEPADAISRSTLAGGKSVVRQLKKPGAQLAEELPPPEAQQLTVAAGRAELVAKEVSEGHSLELVFEVRPPAARAPVARVATRAAHVPR